MGVYNDARYPFFCGDGDGKESYGKLIKNILNQIEELKKKIDELQNKIASADNKSTEALKEAKIALSTAQQALNSMQAIITQINAVRTVAENASLMANDAETKANEAKEIAQGVDDKATEAQETARRAELLASYANEQAETAYDLASQAGQKANVAQMTAEQAIAQGEAFIAVYGETTFSDIQNAINGRRRIYVLENDSLYVVTKNTYPLPNNLGNVLLDVMTFGGTEVITSMIFEVNKSDNSWRKIEFKINIGNTSDLTTQDKTNIVSAINEINQKSSSMPELELGTAVQIATYKEGANRYRVFQKVIDLGALPNSTVKTIAHGIDKTKVLKYLSVQGSASQDGFGNTLPLPCVTLGSESVSNNIYVAVGASNVTISTGRDRSAYTGTLSITYVDNTPIT